MISLRQIYKGFFVTISVVIVNSAGLLADPIPESQVDSIYHFMKDHVVYKKLVLKNNPCQSGIVGTNIQCDFSRMTMFANLNRSENTIKYNIIYNVTQTNRLPQPDGTVREENKDRVVVSTCELRVLKALDAPKGMAGICYGLANSLVDSKGDGSSIHLEMSGDQLIQTGATVDFSDCFANNVSGYRLCASESRMVTGLVDGKIRRTGTTATFYITNPLNGDRVAVGGAEEYLDEEM